MPTYVDEFGNPVSEDEVNSGQYSPIEEDQGAGIGEAIGRGVASFVPSTARQAGGGIEAFGDLTGWDGASEFGHDIVSKSDELLQRLQREGNIQPGTPEDIAFQTSSAVSQIAPYLLSAPSAIAPIALGGLQAAGDRYGRTRAAGEDGATAGAAAVGSGVLNAAMNALPISQVLKPGASLLGRALRGVVTNVPTGAVQRAGELAIDSMSTGQVPESPEALEDMFTSGAVVDALTGGGMGLIGGGRESQRNMTARQKDAADAAEIAQMTQAFAETPNLPALREGSPAIEMGPPIPPDERQAPVGRQPWQDVPPGDINSILEQGPETPALTEQPVQYADFEELTQGQLPAPDNFQDTPLLPEGDYSNLPALREGSPAIPMLPPDEKGVTANYSEYYDRPRSELYDRIYGLLNEDIPEIIDTKKKGTQLKRAKSAKADVPVETVTAESFPQPLKKKVESEPVQTPLDFEPVDKAKPVPEQPSPADINFLKSERGAIDNPWAHGRERTQKIRDPNNYDEMSKELFGRIIDSDDAASERFLRGEMEFSVPFGAKIKIADIPGFTPMVGAVRKAFLFPKTTAEKWAVFDPVYRRALDFAAERDSKTFELAEMIQPYSDLVDKKKVHQALIAARQQGHAFKPTPEQLAKNGLDADEQAAFYSVHKTMDAGLEYFKEGLLAKGKRLPPEKQAAFAQEVDAKIQELRDENYVPFSRFGNRYVSVKDKEGNDLTFELYETKKEQQAAVEKWRRQGHDVKPGILPEKLVTKLDEVPPSLWRAIRDLDPEAKALIEDALPKAGFPTHLLNAKLTPGFSEDLERNISDYILKLTSHVAKTKARGDMDDAIAQMAQREPALHNYANRYKDYVLGNDPELGILRTGLAHYYLGFNPKSAIVNLTQSATTTYPVLGKHVKNPMKTWTRAWGTWRKIATQGEKFRASDPVTWNALQRGIKDGIVTEQAVKEMMGKARDLNPSRRKLSDASMFMFGAAERLNRTHAFLAGFDAGGQKGLTGEARIRFAEDFVRDTQFDYSKANRPEIARGKKAALFTFRLFAGNYIRLLRNNMTKEDFSRVVLPSLATMGLMGGLTALPVIRELIKAAEVNDYDLKKKARKNFGDGAIGDVIMYGLPMLAGLNVSGAMGVGDLAPGLEKGVGSAAERLTLGVIMDPFQRAAKAKHMWDMNEKYLAAEAMFPEALRNASVAGRTALQGRFENARGMPLVEDPSLRDIGAKALGFTPKSLALAYEKQNSLDILDKGDENATKYLQRNLAKALYDKDRDAVAEIKKQMRAAGVRPDIDTIQGHILTFKNPDAAQLKRLPKRIRPEAKAIQRRYKQRD